MPVQRATVIAMSSSSTSSFTIGFALERVALGSSFSSAGISPYRISATRCRLPSRSARSASMRSSSIFRVASLTCSSNSFSLAQRAASASRRSFVSASSRSSGSRIVAVSFDRGELDLELDDAAVGLVELERAGVDLDPQPRRGLVDEVDRLVGQEAVGDVAVAEHGSCDERARRGCAHRGAPRSAPSSRAGSRSCPGRSARRCRPVRSAARARRPSRCACGTRRASSRRCTAARRARAAASTGSPRRPPPRPRRRRRSCAARR